MTAPPTNDSTIVYYVGVLGFWGFGVLRFGRFVFIFAKACQCTCPFLLRLEPCSLGCCQFLCSFWSRSLLGRQFLHIQCQRVQSALNGRSLGFCAGISLRERFHLSMNRHPCWVLLSRDSLQQEVLVILAQDSLVCWDSVDFCNTLRSFWFNHNRNFCSRLFQDESKNVSFWNW